MKPAISTPATAHDTAEKTHEHSLSELSANLHEVESLTNDLMKLLVKNADTLRHEGIREPVEALERWVESYRRGLRAAQKLLENAPELLTEVRSRLTIASDELTRLESEGGNPPSKEEAERVDDINKALRRIDRIMPAIEKIFGAEDTNPDN